MRIVTLNIRHGGGKRIEQIAQYLLSHDADVIVLAEYRENANAHVLRSLLATRGFIHYASPPVSGNQKQRLHLCRRAVLEAYLSDAFR